MTDAGSVEKSNANVAIAMVKRTMLNPDMQTLPRYASLQGRQSKHCRKWRIV